QFDAFMAGTTLFNAGDSTVNAGAEVVGDDTASALPIIWQGVEYNAWPYQIEGLEVTGDGRAPRPTLSVGNVEGTITALCLTLDDLLQAKVTIHTTFAHYLDAVNFDGGNPDADPTQERVEL
ncbi:phage minor tail protein L, partial [Vibrio agarivorans]